MKEQVKEWIKHTVDTELYGNTTREDVKKLLKIAYADILKKIEKTSYLYTKSQYKKLLSAIYEILKQYKTDYTDILENQIRDISKTESSWVKDFMGKVGKSIVIPTSIISSINFSPVASRTNYKELVGSSVTRIQNAIDSSLRTSYIIKNPLENTIASLEKKFDIELKNVDTDVEAFNTTAFSLTDYLIMRTNKEDVCWSCILDSNTCNECADRHGKHFKISEIDVPPLHNHCRCDLIPVSVIGEEGLQYNSYSDWFNDLDNSEKKEVLGPGRYNLYQKGLPIDKFINNGQFISIKNLSSLL